MNKSVFRVGVTRDFLGPDGTSDLDDFAGPLFDGAGLQWEYIAENTPVLQATQVQDYDALLVLGAGITVRDIHRRRQIVCHRSIRCRL